MPWFQALEQFSRQHPQIVLRLNLKDPEGTDTVLIYRGIASSLSRPTPADPHVPVVGNGAEFVSLDLLPAPYNPSRILQANLTWEQTQQLLHQAGIPS
ncbi:MAG: hypothetical protein Q6J78_03160 [Thermostichales cyanobacterium SRBZ-1_bins_19]